MSAVAVYVVAAKALKVTVGSTARILTRGATVPPGVAEDVLADLTGRGLLTAVEIEAVEVSEDQGSPPDPGQSADGQSAPDESWTVERLKEYATAQNIDLGPAKNKDQIVAVITAAREDLAATQ